MNDHTCWIDDTMCTSCGNPKEQRLIGNALGLGVVTIAILVLGFAGWIEGL